jgi:Aminoglycoside/hydroxyurea antibiotic resistance kinase
VGYVAPAELRDGTRAVLKVSPSFELESQQEAEALEHYDGHGAVRLLSTATGWAIARGRVGR